MGKYLKIKKKNVKSSSIKASTHNLKRKTAIKTKIEFGRKKEHFLIADTKLQNDEIKRKVKEKFNKPFFI